MCDLVKIHHCHVCVSLQDEILCDTEELQRELQHLKQEYEKVAQQKIFLQQERQDVTEVMINLIACFKISEGKQHQPTRGQESDTNPTKPNIFSVRAHLLLFY